MAGVGVLEIMRAPGAGSQLVTGGSKVGVPALHLRIALYQKARAW